MFIVMIMIATTIVAAATKAATKATTMRIKEIRTYELGLPVVLLFFDHLLLELDRF